MTVVAWVLICLLAVRAAVALANVGYRRGLPDTAARRHPFISVLIPARNEEQTLPGLLADLSAQTYDRFEVLVWDDHSTDGTRALVEDFGQGDARFRVDGGELPPGWLGKVYACHSLGLRGRGELLVFVDADVRLGPQALARTAARFDQSGLALLSLFPRQVRLTPGEEAVVPVMTWTLLSLLPLALVRLFRSSALAAANGQFMAFDGSIYRRLEPHARFKSHPAEDIGLARFYKAEGLAVEVRLAADEVSCRMYEGAASALQGFTRNVVNWTGGSSTLLFVFAASLVATPLVLGVAWGWLGMAAWLGMGLVLEMAVGAAVGDPWARSLVWAPSRTVVFLVLAVRALAVRWTGGTVNWKGRQVAP